MNPSLAQQCWKAMNHSTPYIGSMYLHTLLNASNQLPSTETTCQDIMKLLTEGPQHQQQKQLLQDDILPPPPPPPSRRFDDSPASLLYDPNETENVPPKQNNNKSTSLAWDGPQLSYTLKYYQHLLHKFPAIMIPRFNDAATKIFGNDKNWWKTIIDEIITTTTTTTTTAGATRPVKVSPKKNRVSTKKRKVDTEVDEDGCDDDIDEEEELQRQQLFAAAVHEEGKVIDKLRMHSCTVQALIDLLQAGINLEQQNHHQLLLQNDTKIEDEQEDSDQTEDEDSDDDDDDDDDDRKKRTPKYIPNIKLLNDIRDYGAKSVLLIVGLALAHVYTTQWMFLIPETAAAHEKLNLLSTASLHDSRVEIVETLVDQLTTLFGIIFKIVTTKNPSSALEEDNQKASGRSRLRRSGRSSVVSKSDAKQALWDAMVMKMDQEESITDDPKLQDQSIRQNLLIRWVGSLEKSLGEEIAQELAKQADVDSEIEMGFAW